MKPLQELADDLAAFCDKADLRRLREMSEAEFAMLLALFGASEIWLAEIGSFPRAEGET